MHRLSLKIIVILLRGLVRDYYVSFPTLVGCHELATPKSVANLCMIFVLLLHMKHLISPIISQKCRRHLVRNTNRNLRKKIFNVALIKTPARCKHMLFDCNVNRLPKQSKLRQHRQWQQLPHLQLQRHRKL